MPLSPRALGEAGKTGLSEPSVVPQLQLAKGIQRSKAKLLSNMLVRLVIVEAGMLRVVAAILCAHPWSLLRDLFGLKNATCVHARRRGRCSFLFERSKISPYGFSISNIMVSSAAGSPQMNL